MSRREAENIDFILGVHYPLQSYGWSGMQIGDTPESAIAGKKPVDAAPMSVTSQPPGTFCDEDTSWIQTYGASHDCVLGLFNGSKFQSDTIANISVAGIYRDAIGTADQHIYDLINGVQQVDFIVAKDTCTEALEATTTNIDDISDVRSISMRIPLMAIGWGRTIGMRPTDPEPTEDSNKRRNDDAHKLDRATWKEGPLDARWDERRGVWGCWNDLIADHNSQDLGTLVFDTCSDPEKGFPFLKGKLEDVWKIIITAAGAPTGKDSDTEKSGDVATHLNHFWTQQDEDDPKSYQFAPLSSTFKIHRGDTEVASCGDEKFIPAPHIEILTSTFFHLNDEFDGPICFTTDQIEDEDLVGCMKFDGMQWVPAVPFDICERGGFELGVLFNNDKILAEKMIEICKMLLVCLGKAEDDRDVEKLQGAAGAAGDASSAAGDAESAIDGLNGGADFMEGDTLSPGDPPLTESGADALNDATATASEAYQNSKNEHAEAESAINDYADAQSAKNDSAQSLSERTAAAEETQNAADKANAELATKPNDPSTREAADKANEANSEAQAAKNDALKDFNDKTQAADDARDTAKEQTQEAIDAGKEAANSGDALEDAARDEGQTMPDDVQNEMDEADAEAGEFEEAANNAGLTEEEEQTQEDLKAELCAKINAGDNATAISVGQGAISQGQATGEQIQKAMNDIATSVNAAVGNLTSQINTTLGSLVGFDTESMTGGLSSPSVSVPPACPTSTSQMPSEPSIVDPGPSQGTGGATSERPKGKPDGKTEAPPPGGQLPPTQAPDPVPKVPAEPPPTCPIITVMDPCTKKKASFGPCPAGEGSGSGRGKPGSDKGPGDPNQNPDGGVDPNTGEVFKPAEGGQPFGLGGEGYIIGLGGAGFGEFSG